MTRKPRVGFDTGGRRFGNSSDFKLTEVAVVAEDGRPLYATTVRPPGVDLDQPGITAGMPYTADQLRLSPSLSQVSNYLKELVRGCQILVWNFDHEVEVLKWLGEKDANDRLVFDVQDLMVRTAPYLKDWSTFHKGYEWSTLQRAAKAFNLQFKASGWHDTYADAAMLIDIWDWLHDHPLTWADSEPLNLRLVPPTRLPPPDDLPF